MGNLHLLFAQIPFLLGEGGLGGLLENFDIIGTIFGTLNQIPFLVDIIVAGALVGAILRGIFKKFWKVTWRAIIFIILLVLLVSFAGMIAPLIGNIGITLKGEINGAEVMYKNLSEILQGVVVESGYTPEYATAFSEVILKNLVMFLGVPVAAILTPIISLITYPIFALLLPAKVKKMKMLPVKLAISITATLAAVVVFSIPMATMVPALSAIKPDIVAESLLFKFLHPEVIGFLELFTKEGSIFIKMVDIGNIPANLNFFKSFTVNSTQLNLSEELPKILADMNQVMYSSTSGA